MPHLHHIFRAAVLAATLLTGVGTLAAQVPAQAATTPPRMRTVTSTHYRYVPQPRARAQGFGPGMVAHPVGPRMR